MTTREEELRTARSDDDDLLESDSEQREHHHSIPPLHIRPRLRRRHSLRPRQRARLDKEDDHVPGNVVVDVDELEFTIGCVACIENKSPEHMFMLPCSHSFCSGCLWRMLVSNAPSNLNMVTCPSCREPFIPQACLPMSEVREKGCTFRVRSSAKNEESCTNPKYDAFLTPCGRVICKNCLRIELWRHKDCGDKLGFGCACGKHHSRSEMLIVKPFTWDKI